MAVSDYIPAGKYDIAQPIHEGYLTKILYPHAVTVKLKVEICTYTPYVVQPLRDISDSVLDFNYDCDCESNPRQTASITVKVDKDDQHWFMRRENKSREWFDGNATRSVTWQPLLYKILKQYFVENDRSNPQKVSFGYFVPTDDSYTYDSTTGTIQINLSGMTISFTKEYGGGITMEREGKTFIDPKTHEYTTVVLPRCYKIPAEQSIDNKLFYKIAMGSYTNEEPNLRSESMPVPVTYASVEGQQLYDIPYDLEFDADICVQDVFDKVLEIAYPASKGNLWIDENRALRVKPKPTIRGDLVMYWRDYKDIVISENISYNDSGFYNITEVYGKDNIYAVCEQHHLDMGLYPRKQVITDDTLQTEELCQKKANWENYKARYGRMSISVSLQDRYMAAFRYPSLAVGRTIEYTTIDGDTNLYYINKISNGSNNWTIELTLFKPLYEVDDDRIKQTLAIPVIFNHEIINDDYNFKIRLYIKGADIGLGVAKIYDGEGGSFVGESANTLGTYKLNWGNVGAYKIVDIPITQNGEYRFAAALYSPFYEDSGLSDWYRITVDEVTTRPITEDPDPYPHPNMFEPDGPHDPYLLTNDNKHLITDDNKHVSL